MEELLVQLRKLKEYETLEDLKKIVQIAMFLVWDVHDGETKTESMREWEVGVECVAWKTLT